MGRNIRKTQKRSEAVRGAGRLLKASCALFREGVSYGDVGCLGNSCVAEVIN